MTTKELIYAEIDNLGEDELEQLYELIKSFTQPKTNGDKRSIMAKLREIQFDGPPDLSTNLDLYLSGEKPEEEPDIR